MEKNCYKVVRLDIVASDEGYLHNIVDFCRYPSSLTYKDAREVADRLNESLVDSNQFLPLGGAYYVVPDTLKLHYKKPVGRPPKPPTKTIRVPVAYVDQIKNLIATLNGENADPVDEKIYHQDILVSEVMY